MKRTITLAAAAAICAGLVAGEADAYTSKSKRSVPITQSGVQELTTFANPVVVLQGSPTDAGSAISFGTGSDQALRDSGASVKIDLKTNLAANRLLIYTSNSIATATPKACLATGEGNDGGGLVGINVGQQTQNCKKTVPLVWGLTDTNTNYDFTQVASPGYGATNGVLVVDTAHVATYVDAILSGASAQEKQKLDILKMKNCDSGALAVNNDESGDADHPQVFPSYFGGPGLSEDLCSAETARVTINGKDIDPGDRLSFSQELSKNIAVVAYNFNASGEAKAPNLATSASDDTIDITSPFYLPFAADFRAGEGGINYGTSTLSLELVTQ